MVAVTILLTVLILTLSLVQQGVGKLGEMRRKAEIRECARLTMEYFMTLPPDEVYGLSKSSPKTGDYSSSSVGNEDLIDFVDDNYKICQELSAGGSVLGNKVQLRYTICPGCLVHEDLVNFPGFVTCMYFFKLRLEYNAVRYGGKDKKIDYMGKMYTGQKGGCDDLNGCGATGDMPDILKNCNI